MLKVKFLKQSKRNILFDVIVYTLAAVCILLFLYPMIYVVSASVTDAADIMSGKMWLFPTKLDFSAYKYIFTYDLIWVGYRNSFLYTVAGTALSLIVIFMAAYPLSRRDFVLRPLIMKIYTFTMYFSGGMIPYFLLIVGLGWYDNPLAVIIPSAVNIWNLIVIKTYFAANIPNELFWAAQVDGCGNFRFFLTIALPLAGPIIAVMTLYNIVGRWNSFFEAMIFFKSEKLFPLQLILRHLLIQNQMGQIAGGGGMSDSQLEMLKLMETMKYGIVIVATLPLIAVFPFVEKYLKKGVMVGSLKG